MEILLLFCPLISLLSIFFSHCSQYNTVQVEDIVIYILKNLVSKFCNIVIQLYYYNSSNLRKYEHMGLVHTGGVAVSRLHIPSTKSISYKTL